MLAALDFNYPSSCQSHSTRAGHVEVADTHGTSTAQVTSDIQLLACIGAAAGQEARERLGRRGGARPVLVLLHTLCQGLCQGRPQRLGRGAVRQALQSSGNMQSWSLTLQIRLHWSVRTSRHQLTNHWQCCKISSSCKICHLNCWRRSKQTLLEEHHRGPDFVESQA